MMMRKVKKKDKKGKLEMKNQKPTRDLLDVWMGLGRECPMFPT